jgi:hypothetical protein
MVLLAISSSFSLGNLLQPGGRIAPGVLGNVSPASSRDFHITEELHERPDVLGDVSPEVAMLPYSSCTALVVFMVRTTTVASTRLVLSLSTVANVVDQTGWDHVARQVLIGGVVPNHGDLVSCPTTYPFGLVGIIDLDRLSVHIVIVGPSGEDVPTAFAQGAGQQDHQGLGSPMAARRLLRKLETTAQAMGIKELTLAEVDHDVVLSHVFSPLPDAST